MFAVPCLNLTLCPMCRCRSGFCYRPSDGFSWTALAQEADDVLKGVSVVSLVATVILHVPEGPQLSSMEMVNCF